MATEAQPGRTGGLADASDHRGAFVGLVISARVPPVPQRAQGAAGVGRVAELAQVALSGHLDGPGPGRREVVLGHGDLGPGLGRRGTTKPGCTPRREASQGEGDRVIAGCGRGGRLFIAGASDILEYLYAVIITVAHVDSVLGIDGQPSGRPEGPRAVARLAADDQQEPAPLVENLPPC